MKTTEQAVKLAAQFIAKRFELKEYTIVGETMQWDGNVYDVFADQFIKKGRL